MASRDIANMHIFLDLKKKFPDLPDETLRNYIFLYAEDQNKCISLLQKESANNYHPSQPFLDFHFPESKANSRTEYAKTAVSNLDESLSSIFSLSQQPEILNSNKILPSGRSTSHAGMVHVPGKLFKPHMSSKPEPHSAPVITSSEKPFTDIYKLNPISSHVPNTLASDKDKHNQIMFSTTKEHVLPPPVHESTAYLPIFGEPEQSKRHAVKLSITPSFPFQQQHINIVNNSVCATASHSSRPGHHTTSLNFQLQPESSSQYPMEISTIPTNIGNPCNSKDFGSHVQISVGSQGATFTALRLQRPNYSLNTSQLLPNEDSFQNRTPSSQKENSTVYVFPNNHPVHSVRNSGVTEASGFTPTQNTNQRDQQTLKNFNSKFVNRYQSSPEYILAVKNHQIAQLDMILNELEKEKSVCSELKTEVKKMELELMQMISEKTSSLYAEELNKLREENRRLRIECNCLLMEVDMCSTGQIPLGVTDEDFYSNIFTGPNSAGSSPTVKAAPKLNFQKSSANPQKSSFEDDEDDERNRWKCKSCTFANHPALEKCEMCELPKSSGSFFNEN